MKLNKSFLLLFFILLAGYILRSFALPQNLLFSYEQGRDFTIAQDIYTLKKFTLLGPKTDIEGIYHGAFYYYLLAGISLLSRGNPETVVFFFNLLNLLTIIAVFLICRELFKEKIYATLGAAITAVSFGVLIYGRWISNVSPSIPLTAFFFFFIIKYLKTARNIFLPLIFFCWGLFLHFEILNFLGATFLMMILGLYVFQRNKNGPEREKPLLIGISLIAFFINLLPFAIFEARHNFIGVKNLGPYVFSQGSGFSLLSNLRNYFFGLNREITNALFPFWSGFWPVAIFYAFLAVFSFLDFEKKRKYSLLPVLFLLWQSPLLLFFKNAPLEQFYSGTNVSVIIAAVFIFSHLTGRIKSRLIWLGILLVYLYFNESYTFTALSTRQSLYFHMPYKEITYGRERKVLDHIQLVNRNFRIDAFTTPIYRPEAWHYLHSKYYPDKYDPRNREFFLIIEPFADKIWLQKWLNDYNKKSVLISAEKIEGIEIQRRKLL